HGLPAWRALVAALNDREPAVQRAAVDALWASAVVDPARWVHAVFHPDLSVRRAAADRGAPPGVAPVFPADHPYEGKEAPPHTFPATIAQGVEQASADELEDIKRIAASFTPLAAHDQYLLKAFLERGTEVDLNQRREAADGLARSGHAEKVFPVLVEALS